MTGHFYRDSWLISYIVGLFAYVAGVVFYVAGLFSRVSWLVSCIVVHSKETYEYCAFKRDLDLHKRPTTLFKRDLPLF